MHKYQKTSILIGSVVLAAGLGIGKLIDEGVIRFKCQRTRENVLMGLGAAGALAGALFGNAITAMRPWPMNNEIGLDIGAERFEDGLVGDTIGVKLSADEAEKFSGILEEAMNNE